MNISKSLFSSVAVAAFLTASVHADVTGKVILKGTPANPDKPIKATDARCKHDKPDFKTENWKIGAAGELAEVVVWIEGGAAKPLEQKPLIDQVGCQYVPHVIAVPKGSTVTIQSSDATLHNVHAVEWRGKTSPTQLFNFAQITAAGKPKQDDKKFDKASVVKLVCDVHPWMNAWVVVVDSPWFAVSGADGAVKITGVADGEYTVKAWHSQFNTNLVQKVKVTGGSATVNFEFDAANVGK